MAFSAGKIIIMRNTHNVPFTLTEIVRRVLPILLEARQKYSPESSSETLVIRRALLKFSNLALSDGRSPPFLYHTMSGVGLGEGPSRERVYYQLQPFYRAQDTQVSFKATWGRRTHVFRQLFSSIEGLLSAERLRDSPKVTRAPNTYGMPFPHVQKTGGQNGMEMTMICNVLTKGYLLLFLHPQNVAKQSTHPPTPSPAS